MDKAFQRDVRKALAEYLGKLEKRGPRGGKPTTAEVAGAGRSLAWNVSEALRDLENRGGSDAQRP